MATYVKSCLDSHYFKRISLEHFRLFNLKNILGKYYSPLIYCFQHFINVLLVILWNSKGSFYIVNLKNYLKNWISFITFISFSKAIDNLEFMANFLIFCEYSFNCYFQKHFLFIWIVVPYWKICFYLENYLIMDCLKFKDLYYFLISTD